MCTEVPLKWIIAKFGVWVVSQLCKGFHSVRRHGLSGAFPLT